MIIREAYRDVTHTVCRRCYDNPPDDAPAFGPVESARWGGPCEFCGNGSDEKESAGSRELETA